jgi:hypothetical protein
MRHNVQLLARWIAEREAIRTLKDAGKPKPWTKDPIFLDNKFCNVHREDDKVTKWIAEHWRKPHKADPDLWFAMVIARLLNRPTSLEALGYPARWKPARFIRMVHNLKAKGEPAFGSAYMVSTNGKPMDKAEYLVNYVLNPLWVSRKAIRPREGDTLEAFYSRLMQYDGMGSFMAAQIVADVKYVKPLFNADDWWTFAASGPGSRRGLNRIEGRPVRQGWNEKEWRRCLVILRRDFPELHAQDLQNCLCEFDKYLRIKNGEGRMKCKYNGRS